MARRRVMNRQELRADYEAAERRKTDAPEGAEGAEEEDVEEDDEEEEEDAEAGAEADDEEGDEGDDEDAPKKPKKKKAPAKPKAKPRARAVKIIRQRVVWGVFNNSNQRIAVYDYPRKADAEAHAAKLTTDKKSTHFIQPVKEAIEEKKE